LATVQTIAKINRLTYSQSQESCLRHSILGPIIILHHQDSK